MLALLSPIGLMTAALDTGISSSTVPALYGSELAPARSVPSLEQQQDVSCELHHRAQRHTVVNAM